MAKGTRKDLAGQARGWITLMMENGYTEKEIEKMIKEALKFLKRK